MSLKDEARERLEEHVTDIFKRVTGFEPDEVDGPIVRCDGIEFMPHVDSLGYSYVTIFAPCPKCGAQFSHGDCKSLVSIGRVLYSLDKSPKLCGDCSAIGIQGLGSD